jgi:hypothetical protein
LPEGITAIYTDNSKTNAGNYTASATFEYDTVNYNEVTFISLNWTINKADYDMSEVEWNYTEAFTCDGTEKEVYLINLPEGITAIYTDNKKTETGNYIASVVLEYDTVNYNAPSAVSSLSWTVNKAKVSLLWLWILSALLIIAIVLFVGHYFCKKNNLPYFNWLDKVFAWFKTVTLKIVKWIKSLFKKKE